MCRLIIAVAITGALLQGCSRGEASEKAHGDWQSVIQSWSREHSGSFKAVGQMQSKGISTPQYTYFASWNPDGYRIYADLPAGGKSDVTLGMKRYEEGATWRKVDDAPSMGAPCLANLFGFLFDPLSPFSMLAGPAATITDKGKFIEYEWGTVAGNVKRRSVCQIDAATNLPQSLDIIDDVAGVPTTFHATYTFGAKQPAPLSHAKTQGAAGSWDEMANESKTIVRLKDALVRRQQWPADPGNPVDELNGRLDFWIMGYPVHQVKSWKDLNGGVHAIPLPKSWPLPTRVEQKSYIEPSSHTPVFEARAHFKAHDKLWRVTIEESAKVRIQFDSVKTRASAVSGPLGVQCYYIESMGGEPAGIIFLEAENQRCVNIECKAADKEAMLALAKDWMNR